MGRKPKEVNQNSINLGEDLRVAFNSDEWHQLFDILLAYEEDGGSANDEVGRLIQKYIEKHFFHSLPWKTEVDFIIKKMMVIVKSWVFSGKPIPAKNTSNKKTAVNAKGLLNREDVEDIVSNAFTKLMTAGTYNPTATEAEKFSYIYQVTYSATMDQLRKLKNFKLQLIPDPEIPGKKIA